MYKQQHSPAQTIKEQTMTSLRIAEISGKQHKDVLEAIRKMETAWMKSTGRKFPLSEYKDASGKKNPMYSLDFKESMYIATKFNDEARARIIIEWDELRNGGNDAKIQIPKDASYAEGEFFFTPLGRITTQCVYINGVRFSVFSRIMRFINYDGASGISFVEKAGAENLIRLECGHQSIWFINGTGFERILRALKRYPSLENIRSIYKQCFLMEIPFMPEEKYTYRYTDREMLEIYERINKSPINKPQVIELLSKGKKGGTV